MSCKVLLIFCGLLMFSCNKDSREEFSFERMNYNGDKVKFTGFYYSEYSSNKFIVIFLYRNGIMFDGSVREAENVDSLVSNLEVYDYSQQQRLPYYWGIYKIENDLINIEEWSSGTGGRYPIVSHMGIIENDTTFVFNDDSFDTMRFKEFTPKPDSMTSFIE